MIKKDLKISIRLTSDIYRRISEMGKRFNYSNSKVINIILESFFYSTSEVRYEDK